MKRNINEIQIRQSKQSKVAVVNAKCWNILKRQAAEFCRNTGLHGYKYISQTQRSKTERYVNFQCCNSESNF